MELDLAQLNEILERKDLSNQVVLFDVFTPDIARKSRAGQFVIVRMDEYGERIPLTVADTHPDREAITLIFQVVGASTAKMSKLKQGDIIRDVVGPLGEPSVIERVGTVVCVGGGIGVAPIYPITRAFKKAGNHVISIIGARTRDMLILENEMRAVSDELFVTTDDGSYGRHGLVTDTLQDILKKQKIDLVIAIGPLVMMRAVSEVTRVAGIRTTVSLNSLMVDGTGMCGGCRVTVGGETRFTCVHGPEFDGHLVNFDELLIRSGIYRDEEAHAYGSQCKLEEKAEKLKRPRGRTPMPKQTSLERVKNFNEVALGYSEEDARREASRCLQCKKAPCIAGCPVDIDIPAFIRLIGQGDYLGSIHKIKEKNSLPAVCGRVCPQEEQCEATCILTNKGEPIAIGRLERFVADYETKQGAIEIPGLPARTGKRVAVIGAGPAGLTVAGELVKMGHDATIFEALHATGGVLMYGIPEFRLPKRIVQMESDYIHKLGADVRVSYVVGKSGTVDELLKNGYDAVFVGTGAGLPYFMNIPGENLNGVYSANEFLTRVNLMKAYLFPKYDTPVRHGENIAVVGGGNVAMDAARCSLRLGAKNVYLVYRRAREQMPARAEEIENAFEEGVKPMLLTNPVRILGDEKGWVKAMECIRMALGEPDSSGRRRPVPVEGSEHMLTVDMVIMAIGQGANPLLTSTTPDIETNKWGNIIADEETGQTSKPGVFAGGDIVTGAATVILAMGAGKKAARAIDQYLRNGKK